MVRSRQHVDAGFGPERACTGDVLLPQRPQVAAAAKVPEDQLCAIDLHAADVEPNR